MNPNLIAPCGMNCNLCIAHFRKKRKCIGCRETDGDKPNHRKICIINNCKILEKNNLKFCSGKCEKYPCKRLKILDKRYRAKYGMSMIANLEMINRKGIRKFIDNEKKRWVRGERIFCVHDKRYYSVRE